MVAVLVTLGLGRVVAVLVMVGVALGSSVGVGVDTAQICSKESTCAGRVASR